jgi:hypothetical protein
MSQIIVNSTLILNGNANCDGNISVTPSGIIIPIANADVKREYLCLVDGTNTYITANGLGPTITTLSGNILIDGTINGLGQGFEPNKGPGCNVSLDGSYIPGYGATHAGLGEVNMAPGLTAPAPKIPYGNHETPVSIGSGSDSTSITNSAYPPSQNSIYVKATSYITTYFYPYFATDPLKSVVGTINFTSWVTDVAPDSQRFHIDLSSGKIITKIYYENLHDSGAFTTYGVKDFTFWGSDSSSSFADTTYSDDLGWVQLNTSQSYFDIHVSNDVADPKYITVTNSVPYRYYAFKFINNYGDLFVIGVRKIELQETLTDNVYGGGAVKIVARSGTVSINGTINVDGDNGINVGGGSGGSIWITAWNIDGSGSMTSRGGNSSYIYGGGGGGGYISLWYDNANTFSGSLSVKGYDDGKIFIKHIDPIMEDRFTGDIWNIKWWENPQGNVTLNNLLTMVSPQNNYTFPQVESKFSLSGSTILVDLDYIPVGSEVNFYNSGLTLFHDEFNWVEVSRREGHIFGSYSQNGIEGQSAIPYDNSNVTFRISKSDSTFSFQFYDTTSTPQTIFSDVLSDLANKRFKIRIGIEKPINDGTSITEYLQLTPTDISNKYVSLYGTPVDFTSVAMNIIGGSSQYYGLDFYVVDNELKWDATSLPPSPTSLESMLEDEDLIRVIYETNMSTNAISGSFDNLKIYNGTIYDAETSEPIVYVDPIYGSDSSNGRQFTPIQNLFVATAWAKQGSIVVLYDGTHNPSVIRRKDLTILGATGAKAVITSANVQDTTGSGWETTALSFYDSQSLIKNIIINDATNGIIVENTDTFEVIGNEFNNCKNPIRFQNCDPLVSRNSVYGGTIAFDFTSCPNAIVYSNLIVDATIGVCASDSSGLMVLSNTFDNDSTAVVIDSSSTGLIVSNNITSCDLGVQISLDSTPVYSFNNNFFNTTTEYIGTPDIDSSNITSDPLYVDSTNYHLQSASPDRGVGLSTYDMYFTDLNGAPRNDSTYDIGAYMFIDGSHVPGEQYYVDGSGNDYVNFGGFNDPFRTLDRAMQVADATININGGFYDTYYLKLKSQDIAYDGTKVVDTFTLTSYFSNFDQNNNSIFVSPNGSDGTTMGGDGTDSGGNGTAELPYRTINRALQDSSIGSNIIVMAGEYPVFSGVDQRIIILASDNTGIPEKGIHQQYIEDLFNTQDFIGFGPVENNQYWSIDSSVSIGGGVMSFTYDGTNQARAQSVFTVTNNYEVTATLRNAIDPIYFNISGVDQTMSFSYNDGTYVAGVYMNGVHSSRFDTIDSTLFFQDQTDNIVVTSTDTRNKWAPLSHIPDSTSVSVRLGDMTSGIAQVNGTDYYINDSKIKWDGKGMDGTVQPTYILQAIYVDRSLSGPIRVSMSLIGNRYTISIDEVPVFRANMIGFYNGPWDVSFFMNQASPVSHLNTYGKGYVSQFVAIGDSIGGVTSDPYLSKTERKTVVIYKD